MTNIPALVLWLTLAAAVPVSVRDPHSDAIPAATVSLTSRDGQRQLVAATRWLQLTGAYTYTDARQQTPLAAGVWQTYEIPRRQYSFFGTRRFSPRLTGLFGYTGSSSYLASVSGRAFQFWSPSRAQAMVSYRRPIAEFQALRYYFKGDNLFRQTYFENGFRTPGLAVTGGMQFEF